MLKCPLSLSTIYNPDIEHVWLPRAAWDTFRSEPVRIRMLDMLGSGFQHRTVKLGVKLHNHCIYPLQFILDRLHCTHALRCSSLVLLPWLRVENTNGLGLVVPVLDTAVWELGIWTVKRWPDKDKGVATLLVTEGVPGGTWGVNMDLYRQHTKMNHWHDMKAWLLQTINNCHKKVAVSNVDIQSEIVKNM